MKRLLAVAVVVAMLLMLISCEIKGGNDTTTQTPETTVEPGTTEGATDGTTEETTKDTTEETTEGTAEGTAEGTTEGTTGETTEGTTEETTEETTEGTTEDTTEAPQPHVHEFGEWVTAKAATCVKMGEQERTCACGEKETQSIDALGHTEVIDAAVAPTCTATGLSEGKHCSVCDAVIIAQETVDKLGHTNADAIVENQVDATCTADGSYDNVIYCSVCSTELSRETNTIVKPGHDLGQWAVTKEPTEDEKGEKRRDCVRCDYYETDIVAELSHNHDRWEQIILPAVDPTCTEEGLTEGIKCSDCGEILTAQNTIPALRHTYGAWTEELVPTCTEKGRERRDCSVCDHYERRDVNTLGHLEVIDKAVVPTCTATGLTAGKHCSVCDEVLVAQTVVEALGHTESAVVVENSVDPTCTETGSCDNVVYCTVCNKELSRENVAVEALGHNYSAEITAPTLKDNGLAVYTCSVCGHSYNEVIIPVDFTITADNRTQIGYTGGTGENLIIPAMFRNGDTWYRVTSIGDYAFRNCSNLMSISIPDSVTSIGNYAFRGCSSLTSISIPNSITSIGEYAFYGCSSLVSVTIPDSVTIIGKFTFYSCSSLTSITLSEKIGSIGTSAFRSCDSLANVYYSGTRAEWSGIGIGSNNSCLTNAKIVYNCGAEGSDPDNGGSSGGNDWGLGPVPLG